MQIEMQRLEFEKWKAELSYRQAIEVAELSAATTLQTAQASAAMAASKGQEVDGQANNQKATLDAVVAHLSKPKKIVRGPDGKVAGIE